MRSVTYSMSVSLDGYIVDPDGNYVETRRFNSGVVHLRYRVSRKTGCI